MSKFAEYTKMFLSNIGAYYPSTTASYALYPFPYVEKSLTFDWDNVGTDITTALNKPNEKGNV